MSYKKLFIKMICNGCGIEHYKTSGTPNCKKCRDKIRYISIKNDPVKWNQLLEKSRIRSRNLIRKKNGLSIDHPKLKKDNGEGTIQRGYKVIYNLGHPNATKHNKIMEHVFVMSEFLKRPLRKGETVHHKNGIRNDNRIENLELWDSRHGPGQRVEDKIKWCKEFLEQYGYKVILNSD